MSESLQTINRVVDVNERWFSIYLDSDHVSDGSRIPVEGCRSSAGDDVAVKQLSAYDELRWHKTCGAVCCLRRD